LGVGGVAFAAVAATQQADDVIAWLIRYPLLPLQVGVILLASWRLLGREVGIERLIWNDKPYVQFEAGFAIAVVFGVVLFVRYLLGWIPLIDLPTAALDDYEPEEIYGRFATTIDAAVEAAPSPSLFPSEKSVPVRRLGAYMFWGLIGLGFVLVLPKLYAAARVKAPIDRRWRGRVVAYMNSRWWLVPGVIGYAAAFGFFHLAFLIDESWDIRSRFFQPQLDRFTLYNPALQSLVAVATYSLCIMVGALGGLWAAIAIFNRVRPGLTVTSPVVAAGFLLVILDLFFGWVVFKSYENRLVLPTLVMVGIGLLVVAYNSPWVFQANHYNYRFPGLDPEYDDRRTGANGGGRLDPLSEREPAIPLPAIDPDAHAPPTKSDGLIPDAYPLYALFERWRKTHPDGTKPKVVVFAVSGGGIRSAVWTAVVLEKLEAALKHTPFRDHIRLFVGASGGMVGAAPYVAAFDHAAQSDRPDDEKWMPQPTADDAELGLG